MLPGRKQALWLVIVLTLPEVALAVDPSCPTFSGALPTLTERSPTERLAWIRNRLRDDARHTQRWGFAWTYGYTALTAVEFAAGGVFGTAGVGAQAVDNVISGGASLVGALFMLVTWLPVGADSQALDARMEGNHPEEVCTVLADAEAMLQRDADAEVQGRAWYTHLLTAGFNLGVAGVLGLWLGHWRSAAITFVGGNVISEAQVFTQPVGARDALYQYVHGELGAPATSNGVRWSLAPMLGPTAAGLMLHGEL